MAEHPPERTRRLGRGLGALISPTQSVQVSGAGNSFREIRLDVIQPNPHQPRRDFSDEELAELQDSMRASGLLQPVTVRHAAGGAFELIAGERRLRAAQRLGWTTIPAFIRDATNEQMLSLALVENLQRADLNPIEEAEGYRQLSTEFGLAHHEIAQAVGKDRSTVTNALRLLALPPVVLQLLRSGALTVGHARALLALPDHDSIVSAAQTILEQRLTVRDVERLAQESKPSPRRPRSRTDLPSAPRTPEVTRIADRLRRHLQTDVSIQADEQARGELRIRFYSADDLDRLLDLIIGPVRDVD